MHLIDIQFLISHLFSVNKRLDDWVTESNLDTRKVQYPRKDGTTTGQNTGITTPNKRLGSSPRTEADDLLNGSSVMAAALQKRTTRKRKVWQPNHISFRLTLSSFPFSFVRLVHR